MSTRAQNGSRSLPTYYYNELMNTYDLVGWAFPANPPLLWGAFSPRGFPGGFRGARALGGQGFLRSASEGATVIPWDIVGHHTYIH